LQDPIVGIDLGTSNSVVAHADEVGVVKVLPDDGGYKIHPSVVSFHPNGGVVVGAGAKQRKVIDPTNTIYSVKRLIGRAFDSPEVDILKERVPYKIKEGKDRLPLIVTRGNNDYAPPEIAAIILDHMKNIATARLGVPVNRAVVTVPASFNDAQRSATATAGEIAGLTVVRVLNEPTAAALAYGNTRNLKEVIAVYDFGGGTFDITILRLNDQVYEVLGTSGDTFLGGDDLDERLVDKMVNKFLSENRIDLRTNEVSMMRLRAVAEQTKIELSRRSRAVVRIDEIAYGAKGKPLNLQIEITRDEFVSQVADIIDRTFPVCSESLQFAGLGVADIDDVILVGGTTKIPYVRDQVSKFFARAPRTDINPEDAVAVGAALQANSLERILSRPRKSTKSVPVQAASDSFGSMDSMESFTEANAPVPESLELAPQAEDDLSEITLTTPAPTTGQPNVKRPTAGYPEQKPAVGRAATGYSVTRSGTRDHYLGRTETTPPDEDTGTKPGVTDPYDSRLPNAQPLARLKPPPDPRKTAFGVPAGPPPLPRPSNRGPNTPRRADSETGTATLMPASEFDLPLTLPELPRAPTRDADSSKFDFEETRPAAVQPSRPPPPPVASPHAATMMLSPDFANEVDTAEALALAEKMAAEASAGSTAKGMGAAGKLTLAGAPAPVIPNSPAFGGGPPVEPPRPYLAAAPAAPTMVANLAALTPGYADEARSSQQRPTLIPPQPLAPPTPARPIPTILEITPRGLGIGTVAGFCEELIRRNERLPATKRKSFTTARDKQAVVRIVVCQGESRRLDNNMVIGDLVLANLPPRPRGETTIEVTFVIDASGILQVSARDQATGAEQRASLDLVGAVPQQDVAASRERLAQLRR
jgi:molecular chaperone DnaK